MKKAIAFLLVCVLLLSTGSLWTCAEDGFDKTLAQFPDAYKPSLSVLHKNHPNWVFEAVNVGKNFSECLNAEHNCKQKMNLVEVDSAKDARACQSNCPDAKYHTLVDGVYRCASYDYIAECMDPTTSLRESLIFQFESLGAKSYYTTEKLETALAATYSFMHQKECTVSKKTYTYSGIILDACRANGVDALFIISRITNEVGAAYPAKLATGYSYEYEKGKTKTVYNFFNIGGNVSASAKYAYNHGWSNPKAALEGGIKFIAANYVKAGQDTNYFQKFQVNPACNYGFYEHQYMQGTDAVMNESGYTFNNYCKLGILDKAHVFKIPVYQNLAKVNYEAQDLSFKNAGFSDTYGYVNAGVSSNLAVRTDPSTSVGSVKCRIQRSTLLKLEGRSGVWYKVSVLSGSYKGQSGYCHGDYVNAASKLTVTKGNQLQLKPKLRVSTCTYAAALSTVKGAVTIDKNGVASGKKIGTVLFKATSSSGQVCFLELECTGAVAAPDFSAKGGKKTVTLSWKAVPDAVSYRIYSYNTATKKYAVLADTTECSFVHKALAEGTAYTYLVRSTDVYGARSNFSTADNKTVWTIAAKPAFRLSAGSNSIKIVWSKVSGAVKYGIWSYNQNTKKYTKIANTTALTYTVSSLSSNKTYTYLVRSYNSSGWSAYTADDNRSLKTAPSAPQVTARGGQNKIILTWKPCAGTTQYRVYRYLATQKKYRMVLATKAQTYTAEKLADGTRYTYLVRAFNAAGTGSSYTAGNAVSAVTLSAKPQAEISAGSSSVTLHWKTVQGAVKYGVWLYDRATKTYKKLTNTASLSYIFTDAAPNTEYTFFVRSYNASGWSPYQKTDCKTVLTAPAKPLPVLEQSENGARLSWKACDGAVKYTIYSFESKTGKYTFLASVKTPGFTHQNAAQTIDGYLVRAVNSAGTASEFTKADVVKLPR